VYKRDGAFRCIGSFKNRDDVSCLHQIDTTTWKPINKIDDFFSTFFDYTWRSKQKSNRIKDTSDRTIHINNISTQFQAFTLRAVYVSALTRICLDSAPTRPSLFYGLLSSWPYNFFNTDHKSFFRPSNHFHLLFSYCLVLFCLLVNAIPEICILSGISLWSLLFCLCRPLLLSLIVITIFFI